MSRVEISNQPIRNQQIQRVVSTPISSSAQKCTFSGSNNSQTVSSGNFTLPSVRTRLVTAKENEMYSELVKNLDAEDKKNLEILLKNGILLNNDSDDKSTTLDNLYKIVTTERVQGLDKKMVLKETINTLANPFVINQEFGDIPKPYVKPIMKYIKPNEQSRESRMSAKALNVKNSSTCVSASIEFALAKEQPAEFARFVNGLTSKNISVKKTIDLSSLNKNHKEALEILDSFKIPYKRLGKNKVRVIFAPDDNAIIRARIQNSHKDEGERSLIDVLMQSTFMNVGSQQTYESLTDNRGGHFSQDSKALIDYEKTFVESVVQNKDKTCFTYQNIDEQGRISGYTTDKNTMLKNISKTLKRGECVIAGYTFTDPLSKKVTGGHEITIVGITKNNKGELMFVYNDTDDGKNEPVYKKVSELLPQINHVGIPTDILEGKA